jgi:two-component system chemotaxis sensor kinase CheA
MDHGIEASAVRAAHRKPSVATIRMSAARQGEHVVVEVSDDGGGIDVKRIRHVALQRDVASAEVLSAMSDDEAINLVFEPGFSTAGEVTALSGRGVGLDTVRTAVERMAGRVGIESRAGQGTTVRLTLPFSVMLTSVMVVGAADQTFGIPLDAVVETLRIDAASIIPIGVAHAIVLRNRTIPLVGLAGGLDLTTNERHEAQAIVVITKIDGQYGALRVDRIGERMEVMLKPLDGLLAGMRGLAGSTLLGDGSVLLILDLAELFR